MYIIIEDLMKIDEVEGYVKSVSSRTIDICNEVNQALKNIKDRSNILIKEGYKNISDSKNYYRLHREDTNYCDIQYRILQRD